MMSMDTLSSLTPLQKRSVFKIAVDMIKADNKIHSKEISVLDKLQSSMRLTQEEMDMVHYITLADAVNSLRDLELEIAEELIGIFSGIMKVDSDISFKENLLLTAVVMSCSKESKDWVHVMTSTATENKVSDSQIVYLEKEHCDKAHKVLDDRYDNLLISKAFADIGLQMFYLPAVLGDLGLRGGEEKEASRRFGLVQKSLGYLMPSGNKNKVENVEHILDSFDTATFFKVVMTGLNLSPDLFPFDSFLLIKVRDSVILDDMNNGKETVDFLCIDISQEVKKRILAFVSNFTEHSFMLPYDGYYKMLFDHLSSESKITSSILLDSEMCFCLENLDGMKVNFESSPQARTLYLLLLFYQKAGISQIVLNEAVNYLQTKADELYPADNFSIEAVKANLLNINTDWSRLIFNTITIYQSISTKDEQKPKYLSYIGSILNHRSSLKTYVNKGFSDIPGLANPEQYHIKFDKEFNIYHLPISSSLFYTNEGGQRLPLTASPLWCALK